MHMHLVHQSSDIVLVYTGIDKCLENWSIHIVIRLNSKALTLLVCICTFNLSVTDLHAWGPFIYT